MILIRINPHYVMLTLFISYDIIIMPILIAYVNLIILIRTYKNESIKIANRAALAAARDGDAKMQRQTDRQTHRQRGIRVKSGFHSNAIACVGNHDWLLTNASDCV